MTELEKKLLNVRERLLDEIRRDMDSLKGDSRLKTVDKKMVYQTGYGKTEYFYYSIDIPSIIVSNDNGNKTNT